MRGEKLYAYPATLCKVGSPPHARGKESTFACGLMSHRITPACAGKSKHYRAAVCRKIGSPPHARGKDSTMTISKAQVRITPACAGKRLKNPLAKPIRFIHSSNLIQFEIHSA